MWPELGVLHRRARDGSENLIKAGIAQLGEPAAAEAALRPGERHVRMTWPGLEVLRRRARDGSENLIKAGIAQLVEQLICNQ